MMGEAGVEQSQPLCQFPAPPETAREQLSWAERHPWQSHEMCVCAPLHARIRFLARWFCRFVIYSISVLNNKSASGKATTPVYILLNHVRSFPIKQENTDLQNIFYSVICNSVWFFFSPFSPFICESRSSSLIFYLDCIAQLEIRVLYDHCPVPIPLWTSGHPAPCGNGTWQQNCHWGHPGVDERDVRLCIKFQIAADSVYPSFSTYKAHCPVAGRCFWLSGTEHSAENFASLSFHSQRWNLSLTWLWESWRGDSYS